MAEKEDPFRERRGLTFEQAEGAAPLPAQLQLKELSQELRARLWRVVYDSLSEDRHHPEYARFDWITGRWEKILRAMHVQRYHLMADDFSINFDHHVKAIKKIFESGDYLEVFGWLQWVMEHGTTREFDEEIDAVLKNCRAPYRIIDLMIVPVGSEAELNALKKAFADLAATEFHGARAHLRNAAELLTAGKWPDSIRESIHAVESVAEVLEPSGEFSKAMARLEGSVNIHGAMKEGFKKLYGYTSDQEGIRHPLLDEPVAAADEADALFMIGACASFVSYVINKARAAGLLRPKARPNT